MKSILMISYNHYSSDTRIQRQAEAACQAGFSVDVIVLRREDEPRDEIFKGIAIRRVRTRYYQGSAILPHLFSYLDFIIRVFFVMSWRLLKKRYIIIHVNNMPDFLVFSTMAAKIFGAKIILDMRDPMIELYETKFPESDRSLWRWLVYLQQNVSALYSDRVLTVSETIKTNILVKDGIPADKISVVVDFVDEEIFSPHECFQIESPLRIIFHGTIAERFGFKSILAAIAKVHRKDRIFLEILGKGEYDNELKELIYNGQLNKFVEFKNRTYPLSRLPSILKGFHLGLIPYEPTPSGEYILPAKMLEFVAMGIPSITVPNAAIRYYFDESMYFPYDPLCLDSLTNLLDRLIRKPSLILEKRKVILENRGRFLWEAERRKYLNILDKLAR